VLVAARPQDKDNYKSTVCLAGGIDCSLDCLVNRWREREQESKKGTLIDYGREKAGEREGKIITGASFAQVRTHHCRLLSHHPSHNILCDGVRINEAQQSAKGPRSVTDKSAQQTVRGARRWPGHRTSVLSVGFCPWFQLPSLFHLLIRLKSTSNRLYPPTSHFSRFHVNEQLWNTHAVCAPHLPDLILRMWVVLRSCGLLGVSELSAAVKTSFYCKRRSILYSESD
jgi:hypothetical protein